MSERRLVIREMLNTFRRMVPTGLYGSTGTTPADRIAQDSFFYAGAASMLGYLCSLDDTPEDLIEQLMQELKDHGITVAASRCPAGVANHV